MVQCAIIAPRQCSKKNKKIVQQNSLLISHNETMCENLIIFQKFYDFTVLLYPIINRIPKSHRMVLGKNLEHNCLRILTLIIKTNKSENDKRLSLHKIISGRLDTLRILIRLAKDLKFVSVGQYTVTAKQLNEISKMIYCWSKS